MFGVYNPAERTLWQITHKQIYEDLELKAKHSPEVALRAIECLERVHSGEEPDDILNNAGRLDQDVPGELVEVLLKSYKWIWGQEDVNYPDGEGRDMSMNSILQLKKRVSK